MFYLYVMPFLWLLDGEEELLQCYVDVVTKLSQLIVGSFISDSNQFFHNSNTVTDFVPLKCLIYVMS